MPVRKPPAPRVLILAITELEQIEQVANRRTVRGDVWGCYPGCARLSDRGPSFVR